MDRALFGPNSPGRLVDADPPLKGCAFIPEPLVRIWDVSLEMWPVLSMAREALAKLDGIGRHLPTHSLLLRPLQRREALRSSSMEGAYATPEELLLYESRQNEATSSEGRLAAWGEVFNYDCALRYGKEYIDHGGPLSLQLIRGLHGELLKGVRGQDKSPGDYRDVQVQVGAGARFVPPPPVFLSECLEAFEKTLSQTSDIDPLLRAFMIHYQFETIHPFGDGNGRVGRLLLSLQIYQEMQLSAPWLYLSPFFEKHKDEYIDSLFRVSTHNDWEGWFNLCLRAVEAQCNDAIRRCDRLVELRESYLTRLAESGAAARLNAVVDKLFDSPLITVPMLAELSSTSYPTAKSDIKRLSDLKNSGRWQRD